MKFGLALPHYDFSTPGSADASWETLESVALAAEALGFNSIWVSDHLSLALSKYGGSEADYGTFDWVTSLGALSAVTSRVRVGVLVACAPLRSALVTAKSAATIDQISKGRFELGLGAGWYEPDFTATSTPFKSARARIDDLESEAAEIRALLTGHGPSPLSPEPYQRPNPPIFFGGKGGGRLLGAVAREADGWNVAWAMTPQNYETKLDRLRNECESAGRDIAEIRLTLGLTTLVGRDEADLKRRYEHLESVAPVPIPGGLESLRTERLAGSAEEVATKIAQFEALGVDEIICGFGPVPFYLASQDDVEAFAKLVIAELT